VLALGALAALYLQSELEQALVIPVAELLAAGRSNIGLISTASALKLEEFARRSRDWYDQLTREQLFARLFGSGRAASSAGAGVNHDFQLRLATLCQALLRYSEDYAWGQKPGPGSEAALAQTMVALLQNLGPRQFGNVAFASQLIQDQLQRAVDLLNDSDVGAIFGGVGLWSTLRAILGPETPDIARYVTRGQSGMQLLRWLASAPIGPDEARSAPLLPANATIYRHAASWIEATGLARTTSAPRSI
jgi:hypothetical protein